MKKKLCMFYLGPHVAVRLYVTDDGDGGSAKTPYGNGTTAWEFNIGIAKDWVGTLACFIHECEEVFMLISGAGYNNVTRWSKHSEDRKFFLSHQVLTEMNLCVADALDYVEPRLKKVWREFRAEKKCRKRKAKRKK